MKIISIIICFYLLLVSCKTNKLVEYKSLKISEINYNETLKRNEDFFVTHNNWILNGIDSISDLNQTFILDTLTNSSDFLNVKLLFQLTPTTIKNKKYFNYTAEARPLYLDIFNQKKYVVFGVTSGSISIIDSFYNHKIELRKGFNGYFNTNLASNITPWRFWLKPQNMNQDNMNGDNSISFSVNNIKFVNKKFTKDQRLYFKRIINNSFCKYVEKNNQRVKNKQKERNQLFIKFYNNTKKLVNKKTDYSVDFIFSESIKKDSIYLDLKYYSKKNKEVNNLIPDLLETHYSFNKSHFDLGNHVDINLEIRRIIAVFVGNNQFIRYGKFE
nr:hypothetical protein [Pseudopedobacter sp.]